MSLINKELIKKNSGIVHRLSNFIPEKISKEYLFICMKNSRIDFTDEEKEILLDTVNIFNLFAWRNTIINAETDNAKLQDFWTEIDKQQVEYMNSFYLDENIYIKRNTGWSQTYNVSISGMKNLLKKI